MNTIKLLSIVLGSMYLGYGLKSLVLEIEYRRRKKEIQEEIETLMKLMDEELDEERES